MFDIDCHPMKTHLWAMFYRAFTRHSLSRYLDRRAYLRNGKWTYRKVTPFVIRGTRGRCFLWARTRNDDDAASPSRATEEETTQSYAQLSKKTPLMCEARGVVSLSTFSRQWRSRTKATPARLLTSWETILLTMDSARALPPGTQIQIAVWSRYARN